MRASVTLPLSGTVPYSAIGIVYIKRIHDDINTAALPEV